jgi:8-oxo-dGTP pyrophosphatase MutT (NUDIX family)
MFCAANGSGVVRRKSDGANSEELRANGHRQHDPARLIWVSEREAVRAVFVDATGAVFLMRIIEPRSGQGWWITPGGGIEAGEIPLAALHREAYEELGVDLAHIGTPKAVWHRRVAFSWDGGQFSQHETFYLIRCDRFDPPRCEDGDGQNSSVAGEPRWWTATELRASSENIAPAGLAELLEGLERDVPLQTPRDISV